MLAVKTSEQVIEIIENRFGSAVQMDAGASIVAAEDILSCEDIPGFDRSTVDGFAVRAADTFGCSESIPAILKLQGEILMGCEAKEPLRPGCCIKISTGGMLPAGADAVVMLEYTEEYRSKSSIAQTGFGAFNAKGSAEKISAKASDANIEIGILKSVAAGSNIIFRGDDRREGEPIIKAGRRLTAADVGALAAAGVSKIKVQGQSEAVLLKDLFECEGRPVIGIISTGDELIPIEEKPAPGQIRNSNSLMLMALAFECGAASIDYGIIKDDEAAISAVLDKALSECDAVLISGGSSAGEKDKTAEILASRGELLLHGIAIKPGKPTILADANGKAIFGLPGHPAAALLVSELFVKPLIKSLVMRGLSPSDSQENPRQLSPSDSQTSGREQSPSARKTVTVALTENISSNHGREQIVAVRFRDEKGAAITGENGLDISDVAEFGNCQIDSQAAITAEPIITKSGLITALAGADGYFIIPRDCEGLPKGSRVQVYLFDE